jgi:hypothetical protein
MVTLRCTQKLLRRVGVSPKVEVARPTTVLGDWYADLVYLRPHQLVLCMNEWTLLVALVPARESRSLGVRFRDTVVAQLSRLGVPRAAVKAETLAMSEVAFGPTASRSLLGCLREAAFALSLEFESQRFSSLAEIEDYFSEYIYSTTKYRHPRELALELFGATGVSSVAAVARVH